LGTQIVGVIACVLCCSGSLQASKVGVYVAVGTGFSFVSYGLIPLDIDAVIDLFYVFEVQTSPPYDFQHLTFPSCMGGWSSFTA